MYYKLIFEFWLLNFKVTLKVKSEALGIKYSLSGADPGPSTLQTESHGKKKKVASKIASSYIQNLVAQGFQNSSNWKPLFIQRNIRKHAFVNKVSLYAKIENI